MTGWPYARRRAALLFAELGLAAPFTLCPAATDPGHRAGSEVDVLKEIFRRPGAQSLYGPVLAEDDVIGTKVRARRPRSATRPDRRVRRLPPLDPCRA